MKDLGIRVYPDPILRTRAERLIGVRSEERRLLARVVQHEIDHLNGVLIIDHGPPVNRAAALSVGRA